MNHEAFRQFILGAAGVDPSQLPLSPPKDTDMACLIEALYDVYLDKSRQYGDYVDEQIKDPEFAVIDHFVNIRRKFIRARNQVSECLKNPSLNRAVLVDTYADMAVYSMLGVILAYRLGDEQ